MRSKARRPLARAKQIKRRAPREFDDADRKKLEALCMSAAACFEVLAKRAHTPEVREAAALVRVPSMHARARTSERMRWEWLACTDSDARLAREGVALVRKAVGLAAVAGWDVAELALCLDAALRLELETAKPRFAPVLALA